MVKIEKIELPNNEFYYKSPDEMKALFADLPSAIINVETLVKQFEGYDLARETLLPEFDIPAEFVSSEDLKDGGKRGENAYLKHQNLAQATRYLVHELFGKHGLVILDGDDKRLKEQFIPIIKKDVLQQGFVKTIKQCSEQLAKDYKAHAPSQKFLYLV